MNIKLYSNMTQQAANILDLLQGESLENITTTLSLLKNSVVKELQEYYRAKDIVELADKIYLYS